MNQVRFMFVSVFIFYKLKILKFYNLISVLKTSDITCILMSSPTIAWLLALQR